MYRDVVITIRESDEEGKCDDCGKEYSSSACQANANCFTQRKVKNEHQQESSHSKCQKQCRGFAPTSISNFRNHFKAVSFRVVHFPSRMRRKRPNYHIEPVGSPRAVNRLDLQGVIHLVYPQRDMIFYRCKSFDDFRTRWLIIFPSCSGDQIPYSKLLLKTDWVRRIGGVVIHASILKSSRTSKDGVLIISYFQVFSAFLTTIGLYEHFSLTWYVATYVRVTLQCK